MCMHVCTCTVYTGYADLNKHVRKYQEVNTTDNLNTGLQWQGTLGWVFRKDLLEEVTPKPELERQEAPAMLSPRERHLRPRGQPEQEQARLLL